MNKRKGRENTINILGKYNEEFLYRVQDEVLLKVEKQRISEVVDNFIKRQKISCN